MKKLKTLCGGFAVLSMCWLACGCSNDAEVLSRELQRLSTNTTGKITFTLEVSTWSKKGTWTFDGVKPEAFNE